MKRLRSVWVAVALALFVVDPAVAAEFASQPVRIVAPFPPGGGTDVVARVIAERLMLVAHPSLGVGSGRELVTLAKAQPGRLSFASLGSSSPRYLGFEWFKRMAGIDTLDLPYKAQGQALVGRDIDRYRRIIALTGARPE